jgi:hypothetical protein
MALIHADFVEETTTTTGTGTLSLAGITANSRTFVAGIGNSNTCVYGIEASNGQKESGVGTVTAGTPDTLSRDTLLSSSTGAFLDLPSGTHTVYCAFSGQGGDLAYSAAQPDADITWTGIQTLQRPKEVVAELTGNVISATAGTQLYKTLTAATTFSTDLQSGESVTLRLQNPDGYAVTWPAAFWRDGEAPTSVGAHDIFVFSKQGEYVYATNVGSYSLVGEDYGDLFTMMIRTTGPNETFTLPLHAFGVNATVYWGDGSSDLVTSNTQPELTHTYAEAGDYNVQYGGTVYNTPYFNGGGHRLKVIEIKNWGGLFRNATAIHGCFYGCSNMTISATDAFGQSTTNCFNMFKDCASMTSADVDRVLKSLYDARLLRVVANTSPLKLPVAPTGTYQDADSPTTGAEYQWQLENGDDVEYKWPEFVLF